MAHKKKGCFCTLSFVFCLVGRTEALPRMPLAQKVDWGELRSKAASESLTLRKRCKSMVYSVRFIKSGKNRVKLKFIYPFSVFYKLLKYSAL